MKRILTGIKPTGKIHLGNYFAVVKELLEMQNKYEVFLMIADLHAQTIPYFPQELKQTIYDLVKSLIALGINTKKVTIFKQSDIPAHLYLFWFLTTISYMGELSRMHEFKEQREKYGKEGIGVGIFLYPVLMTADIILYNTDIVPVGEDQRQHLELCRELTKRFNNRFKTNFKIPEIYLNPETAKIMSLQDPTKKMSKSNPGGCLEIFDSLKKIKEKILKSVTDSEKEIKYDPINKPGISNLMTIFKYLTQKSYLEIEELFKNKSYYEFKLEIFKAFTKYFSRARKIKQKISNKKIDLILKKSAKKINIIANRNLDNILKKMGLK
ncbi:MAG: tryptophan--tRNA ligase [Patescibacteria group bacterium]|nr:tryptophan--tRNA ligase [Patescibacteria group bacterium]